MRITLSINRAINPLFLQHSKRLAIKKSKKQQQQQATETSDQSALKVKIGLEIHARIQSNSKIFSDAPCRDLKLSAVNSKVSVFDAALPGTLPTLNRRCVEASLLTALALKCQINCLSSFERKHYFYADLPAGFQITQQRQPIACYGTFSYPVINPKTRQLTYKQARIRRIQLEHDSARSLLTDDLTVKSTDSSPSSSNNLSSNSTLIDLNRVGMGLMEIVTEPDFDEAFDSYSFARELAFYLRSLGTCEAQMSDGGFRVDVNVSVHEPDPNSAGQVLPGVRVELKNLNSFNAVLKATEYEIERQKKLVMAGGRVELETRTYDSQTRTTVSIRSKEDQYDYRFMPEPNLLPLIVLPSQSLRLADNNNNHNKCLNNPELIVTDEFLDLYRQGLSSKFFVDLDKVKKEFQTKQLPQTRRDFLIEHFNLTHEHAFVFIANNLDLLLIEIDRQLSAVRAEQRLEAVDNKDEIGFVSRILLYDYLELVNLNVELDKIPLGRRCEKIISFADVLRKRVISRRVKGVVFGKLFEWSNLDKLAIDVVREANLFLIEDADLVNATIDKLFEQNRSAIDEYKSKEKKRLKIFDFFVGRVHKELNDRPEPDLVDRLVLLRLKKLLN